MSGKPYTMKEMKAIVDYLIQQKAYKEIKGRKMWMDYANSNLTSRTWQSMKETFLKRILPDIKNPYYKLTVQQIESFQQGYDLESRLNNKLQICTVDDDSTSSDANHKDPQVPGPSNVKEVDDIAGEIKKCSHITEHRSSAETVIGEPCYNTAEEIQKDLESPKQANEKNRPFKDYITFSDPLTPMIQDMLNDFATDDDGSDKEPQMQIVEDNEPNNRNDDSDKPAETHTENGDQTEASKNIEVHNKGNTYTIDKEQDKAHTETECIDISDDANDSSNGKQNSQNNEVIQNAPPVTITQNTLIQDTPSVTIAQSTQSTENSENMGQHDTINSVDTLLPNNQEELGNEPILDDNTLNEPSTSNKLTPSKPINKRKRAKSHETHNVIPKKRHVDHEKLKQSSSDLDTKVENNKKDSENIEKVSELSEKVKMITSAKEKQSDGKLLKKSQIPSVGDPQTSNNKGVSDGDKSLLSTDITLCRTSTQNVSSDLILHEQNMTPEANRTPDKSKELPKRASKENLIRASHSDSDDVHISPKKEVPLHRSKSYRDRALGNVFGFAHGGTSKSRRKSIRSRIRSSQHGLNSSLSSECTSDTGSEYVSPPRGRKNRQTRKYLRPKSARVLCLEEEGGLFVMHGKKIYPVVKDGKIIKNYLTYTPGNDSDTEDSFWKSKYVEEKKKTEELRKLLESSKQKDISPVAPAATVELSPSKASTSKDLPEEKEKVPDLHLEEKNKEKEETKVETVKIKFMKNNEEVQLEGHWSHINPVLAQVVQIFHKNTDTDAGNVIQIAPEATAKPANQQAPSTQTAQDNSGGVTPLAVMDVDVHEKVTELEKKIFKEIEEREKEDTNKDTNVTKRKIGRSNKSSPSMASPAKKTRAQNEENKTPNSDTTSTAKANGTRTSDITTRQTRTPKKALNGKVDENNKNENEVTKRRTRNSSRSSVMEGMTDFKARYKFPSPQKSKIKSETKNPPVNTRQRSKRTNVITTARSFSSPDNCMHNSIESTQGYQDSEDSNLGICLRKKRRLSLSVLNKGRDKKQRSTRRKPRLYISNDLSSDSSHSFVTAPLKSLSNQNSSLNTEVYRSESYQLLFEQGKSSFQHLEKIEETSPISNETDLLNVDNSDVVSNSHSGKSSLEINIVDNFSHYSANDGEHSSNVTLPPSPVLSIVENLSVSKNLLNTTDDMPLENKNKINKYISLDVDMSLPLMKQEGNLQKSDQNESESHFKFNVPEVSSQISDSFLNKICTVNIKDHSLSDSIHQKLRNLILESAKKFVNRIDQNENNNEEKNIESCEPRIPKKTNAKKRCSTPRKKQNKNKLKPNNVERPLIEEEHMESCVSKSCPPVIATELIDEIAIGISPDVNKTKPRKKKDVIKVKILKPKAKPKANDTRDTVKQGHNSILQADSGINDTESGVFLLGMDESIDLIHNHSDTCLNAHECMNDSDIEIIDNNARSVISLNSNTPPIVDTKRISKQIQEHMSLDIFCDNAQHAKDLATVTEFAQNKNPATTSDTVFFTPVARMSSANSILTDDLSDESPARSEDRVSAWYLLSEDERSNTNHFGIDSEISNCNAGCGANLQQIFPITCAVPDLSTITEENTRKFTIDGDTRNEFDSQSLPNFN